MPPLPLDRAAEMNAVLRVWARAFGCSTNQVTDVARRAGLPMEKLWNSMQKRSCGELDGGGPGPWSERSPSDGPYHAQ